MPPFLDPYHALSRLRGRNRPFLLESGSDADGCGACSFVGCDPISTLTWSVGDPGDPFELLAHEASLVPCIAVGFLGYGLASVVESKVPARPDDRGFPDLSFAFYDAVWQLDHPTGKATIMGPGRQRLRALLARDAPAPEGIRIPLAPRLAREQYQAAIDRILDYIRAGDVYQVNFTHRLSAQGPIDPLSLFGAVRRFGAPFGAFLDLGQDFALVSCSPERFLRVQGDRIETRPIKGTCARASDAVQSLIRDEKERAEHIMIVDVARNDLGRVCEPGSIQVERMTRVVSYSTLCHLVSTVAGTLRDGADLAHILRATFPGASITGAPKIRAMQVISELETWPRGPYTGALGRIGPRRGKGFDLDLAMTIRTAACSPGWLDVGVGGGIVADSKPDAEWQETLLKANVWTDRFNDPEPTLAATPFQLPSS